MRLDAHGEMPVHPAPAVVVGATLEVAMVVFLTAAVLTALVEDVVADEDDDDGAGTLDPVSAALTAWSYLPFAITLVSARPSSFSGGGRTMGLGRIPEHDTPKGRIVAPGLRDDRPERRRVDVAAPRGGRG